MQQYDSQAVRTPTYPFLLFTGVILPVISITLEASTHICANFFFDPIPSFWHLAIVVFVPLAQLQTWFAIRRRDPQRLKLASLTNGAVIGISIFYSIIYLSIAPLGLLTLLVVIGLLPLTPYLSLLGALLMRKRLQQIGSTAIEKPFGLTVAGLLAGLSFTIVALGLMELPAALTRYGLNLDASDSPERRSEGI